MAGKSSWLPVWLVLSGPRQPGLHTGKTHSIDSTPNVSKLIGTVIRNELHRRIALPAGAECQVLLVGGHDAARADVSMIIGAVNLIRYSRYILWRPTGTPGKGGRAATDCHDFVLQTQWRFRPFALEVFA
jgi:hypothetical protein